VIQTAIAFLTAGALGLIGIILVLIFDRPKHGKDSPAEGKNQPPR